jgi:acylphosphatase
MFQAKVDSTSFNNAKNRLIKYLGWGPNDVRNHPESMPYGLDSNPIKDMIAIYAQNANGGQSIVIGYINKNQLADVGEMRVYATDKDGNLQGSVWCKKDGEIDIVAQGNSTKIKLNQGTSKAVLGDKNKTALTDFYNAINIVKTFATAAKASVTDPTLVTAATALETALTALLPTIQSDINATESNNLSLE